MSILYKKPGISSYSAVSVIEELGPCQNQYNSSTLNPSSDNWMLNNGAAYVLGTVQEPSWPIMIGCVDSVSVRGFFSFDISSIQSTVVSATLKVYQVSSGSFTTVGTPYSLLGNLTVDHVNFGTLEANATDFNGNDLTRNLTSTSDSTNNSWKEFDVKTAVQADLDAGRTTSQFRVRFATNTSGSEDFIYIEDIDNHGSSGNKPELVVTYSH